MWRVAERWGNELTHVLDFRSEDHAKALCREMNLLQGRTYTVYSTEGRFESPHLWRVWPIGPYGTPDTSGGPLVAATQRSYAEAYIHQYRPIGEEWALFRLMSNGDQDCYGLSDGMAVPPVVIETPAPVYHAVRVPLPAVSGSLHTEYEIAASYLTREGAEAYIRARPSEHLILMSTIGMDADALLKPVAPEPVREPQSAQPRRRAIRL